MKKKNFHFLKPIIQMMAGSAVAQIITILVSPISTRLYSSEQLGTYTLILTVVSMFGPILSGRYEMSIVTSKNKKDEVNLIVGSVLISIVSTILVSSLYYIYLVKQKSILGETGPIIYLLIPLLLIITAITNILTSYNNKNKEYKLMSKVYVLRTFLQNIGIVIFGLLNLKVLGLVFSQLLSSLFGIKEQSKRLLEEKIFFELVSFNGIKKILYRERNQFFYSVPATLLNTGSYSILNFFVSGLFGLKIFGFYSMSYRMLGLPLTLISINVSKVFFQEAFDENNIEGNYYKTLRKYSILLILIALPMVIILMIFSPFIFELFFGDGWFLSGMYVRILAPMFGIRLIVSSIAVSLIISERQQLEFLLQASFIIISLVVFIICKIFNFNEYIFFSMISASYSLIYIVFYIIIYNLSKKIKVG